MINKSNIKFYLIAGGAFILILLIVLIIPMGKKNTGEQSIIPTPTAFPTAKISIISPTNGPTPTLIPLRFTGADLSQDLPSDVKLLSEQKTELRRKTPLDLSFGVISFDYENDKFNLILKDPKDQSKTTFNTWLKQTYPALPAEQFAIQ